MLNADLCPRKYKRGMKSWEFGEVRRVFNVVSEEVLWGNEILRFSVERG